MHTWDVSNRTVQHCWWMKCRQGEVPLASSGVMSTSTLSHPLTWLHSARKWSLVASIIPKTLCECFILYKLWLYNILFKVTPLLSEPPRDLQGVINPYHLIINQVFLGFNIQYGSGGFSLLFIYEYARIIFKLISCFNFYVGIIFFYILN